MFAQWKQPREANPNKETPARFEVAAGVSASPHDNGIVFLHVATGRIFQSNHVGAAIWQGISAGRDSAMVASDVSADFGTSLEVVARHVSSFVAVLEQQGFVSRIRLSRQ